MATITSKIARELLQRAAILFRQGAGLPIGEDAEYDTTWDLDRGVVDEIHPEQFDLAYWANNVLLFLRMIYGIWDQALNEETMMLLEDSVEESCE